MSVEVFTCTVGDGIFRFQAGGVREEALGLEAAKKVAARLIALAVKDEQRQLRERDAQPMQQRSPRQLPPLYPA